jgi:hypothetical protein
MTAELFYGLAAPLVVAVVSFVVVKRAYLANPSGLMPVLLAGMAIKLACFAAYAVVMLRVLHLQPVPFVASFTCSFIVLHNLEALLLKRLFTTEC